MVPEASPVFLFFSSLLFFVFLLFSFLPLCLPLGSWPLRHRFPSRALRLCGDPNEISSSTSDYWSIYGTCFPKVKVTQHDSVRRRLQRRYQGTKILPIEGTIPAEKSHPQHSSESASRSLVTYT